MKIVRDILREKGSTVWTIGPEASVYEALSLMADKNLGAVLVMDSSNLVGILSERDYARKVVLKGRMSKDTPVRDIMTAHVVCVTSFRTIEECMALMTDKRIRHLPVVEGDRLVGIISIGDVVRAMIADKDFIIEQLTDYITGKVR